MQEETDWQYIPLQLRKIRALQKANEEIIERVECLEEVNVVDSLPDCTMRVTETFEAKKVDDIIREYKCKEDIKTDICDSLDWSINGWDDLKRLNRDMFPAVSGQIKSAAQREKHSLVADLLHNYETIQVELGSIEQMMISQKSSLATCQTKIGETNKLISSNLVPIQNMGAKRDRAPLLPDFLGGDVLDWRQIHVLTRWYGAGWKLKYKASRDGWDAASFHRLCDGKGASVTVIKTDKGFIYGGFLSISWQSYDDYGYDSTASLFTLVNPHGIEPTKFRVIIPENAVFFYAEQGPAFGNGHDIYVANNASSNNYSANAFGFGYEDTTGKRGDLFTGKYSCRLAEVEVYIRVTSPD